MLCQQTYMWLGKGEREEELGTAKILNADIFQSVAQDNDSI